MAWRRIGDKPLSEPMLLDPLTHICGTRGRWVNLMSMRLLIKDIHAFSMEMFFWYQSWYYLVIQISCIFREIWQSWLYLPCAQLSPCIPSLPKNQLFPIVTDCEKLARGWKATSENMITAIDIRAEIEKIVVNKYCPFHWTVCWGINFY